MAGRPRRASTSSVESVCEADIRWRQESSVVRTVSKDEVPDNWPIFELTDAVVLDKDGQNMENALLVGKRGPFIVRGRLVIDDPSQKSHLIMRFRTSTPMEIRRSILYSIGESEDGRPLIWVSGQGGWYEIDPCTAYKPMYRKMCEATTMYYTLLDMYSERPPKKPKKGKAPAIMEELGTLFHKYATRIGDGSTFEEVIARAREHSSFLMDKLAQNDGPFDWQATAFYKWIFAEHAERQENVPTLSTVLPLPHPLPYPCKVENSARENAQARSVHGGSSKGAADIKVSAGARDSKTTARVSLSRVSDKPAPSPAPATGPPPEASGSTLPIIPLYEPSARDDAPGSPLRAAFAVMEKCFAWLASSRHGMTFSSTLTRLYFTHSFPNYRDGRVGSYRQPVEEYLHYYSRALLPLLDDKYRQQGIYAEFKRLADTELRVQAYKPRDFPVIIHLRNSGVRKAAAAAGFAPSTPAAQTSNPNHGYAASDSPKPMGKRPTRTPGKSSLQPIGRAPKKRPRNEFEGDGAQSALTDRIKVENGDGLDQDTDMDDVQPMDSGEENDADDMVDSSGQDAYGLEPIKLVIRADKIPESSPQGPDDTWTCDQEDCGYIVRGSDEKDCHERIQQHFRDHEQQLTRVNLAMTEGARGHMPINHLLDKIKQLRGEPADAQTQPIKRKLIM